jgi:hypothetical protein
MVASAFPHANHTLPQHERWRYGQGRPVASAAIKLFARVRPRRVATVRIVGGEQQPVQADPLDQVEQVVAAGMPAAAAASSIGA